MGKLILKDGKTKYKAEVTNQTVMASDNERSGIHLVYDFSLEALKDKSMISKRLQISLTGVYTEPSLIVATSLTYAINSFISSLAFDEKRNVAGSLTHVTVSLTDLKNFVDALASTNDLHLALFSFA